jgi:uncharacterized membrane protein
MRVDALSAPALVDLLDMQFRSLYFDRRALFLVLQLIFLVLNGGLTFLLLALGPNYLGLGFLAASTLSALAANLALARTLYRLEYLTFIANNPAVRIRRVARAF